MLKFYSGFSNALDSSEAVYQSLVCAFGEVNSFDCELVICHVTMGHDFDKILSELRTQCPSAQITGCTVGGVVGKEGFSEDIRAFGLLAIRGNKSDISVTSLDAPVKRDFEFESELLVNNLYDQTPNANIILYYPGFLCSSVETFFKVAENKFGKNIKIIGGISIDNNKFLSNFQFVNEKILENNSIVVGLTDPSIEVISFASHGFESIGKPMRVTGKKPETITELDGKPAWNYICNKLDVPLTTSSQDLIFYGVLLKELDTVLQKEFDDRFYVYGAAFRSQGDEIYRIRSISLGDELFLGYHNEKLVFEKLEIMMDKVVGKLLHRTTLAVIHSDCCFRGRQSVNKILKEELINKIQQPIFNGTPLPWLGMYGGGELCPLGGSNFHQAFTTSLNILVRRNGL